MGYPISLALFGLGIGYLAITNIADLQQLDLQISQGVLPDPPMPSAYEKIIVVAASPDSYTEINPTATDTQAQLKIHSDFISMLETSGASVLLYDFAVTQSRKNSGKPPTKPGHLALHEALLKTKRLNVVLATIVPTGEEWDSQLESLKDDSEPNGYRLYTSPLWIWRDNEEQSNVRIAVVEQLETNAGYIGAVLKRLDYRTNQNILYGPFAAVLYHLSLHPDSARIVDNRYIKVGQYSWSLNLNQASKVVFPDIKVPFRIMRLNDAMAKLRSSRSSEDFNAKIVIFGASEGDVIPTQKFGKIPGTHFLAYMTASLLNEASTATRPVSRIYHFVIYSILTIFFTGSLLVSRKPLKLLLIVLTISLTVSIPILVRMTSLGTISILYPLLAICLAAVAYGTLAMILGDIFVLKAAGEHGEATVLFADIHDSTVLVREIGPDAYQALASNLVNRSHYLARKYSGEIERTTGDGYLAVFEGIDSALNCLNFVQDLLSQNLSEFPQCSFGMESGEISGGYVYESGRRTWSSAGLAINLAQRLQSSSKLLGQSLIVGPAAATSIGDRYPLKPLGRVELKGFDAGVDIFGL